MFQESIVSAGGFRIRCMTAGDGPPLVYLHGGGGLHLTEAHDLLTRRFRVTAFEMPGFGTEENTRTPDIQSLALTMAAAAETRAGGPFALMGTSFGGKTALWLAVQRPDLVSALVLEGPAAIRPEGTPPVSGGPADIARRLYAHPERVAPPPPVAPALAAQRLAFLGRMRGPGRDPVLEDKMRALSMPVLVVFGARDTVVPPEMGRIYKELIPGSHLVFIYDAGHEAGAERPEAMAEVVADFLERNDAFVISRSRSAILP